MQKESRAILSCFPDSPALSCAILCAISQIIYDFFSIMKCGTRINNDASIHCKSKKKSQNTDKSMHWDLAEKEGFEP